MQKKQQAAVLNYPTIIEKIKAAAGRGDSEVQLSESLINEFDKKLLEADGFNVKLIDKPKERFDPQDYKRQIQQYNPDTKIWVIKW